MPKTCLEILKHSISAQTPHTNCGGRVMIWASFTPQDLGTLQSESLPWTPLFSQSLSQIVSCKRPMSFMTAGNLQQKVLKRKESKCFVSQSSDFSLTEIWDLCTQTSINWTYKEEWAKISPLQCERAIKLLIKWMLPVIAAKAGSTSGWNMECTLLLHFHLVFVE